MSQSEWISLTYVIIRTEKNTELMMIKECKNFKSEDYPDRRNYNFVMQYVLGNCFLS